MVAVRTSTPSAVLVLSARAQPPNSPRCAERDANATGRYAVIHIGCGSGCVLLPIVDAQTSVVHRLPLTAPFEFVMPMVGPLSSEVEFRPDSRLWTMTACPEQQSSWDGPCFRYFFLWQDEKWTQLRKVPLREDER